ncbi:flagellar biosynthesis protein FlhF [Pseudidiomarina gelatinasegens]|uniref:flagellar biosynthesis protein FlhF n=1 Tax=Pseudidiomarina gelatinasegens TaxID=2487740 RepID=UPI003A9785D9
MTIRRFNAASHKDAMRKVRDALGEDAVIVSSRKVANGAEVFAIGEADLAQLHNDDAPKTQLPQSNSDLSSVAEQLLSDVQDMRALLSQQQGVKVQDDNRKRLYRQLRAGGFSDELARQLVALLPSALNHSSKNYADALKWLQQQLLARVAHQSNMQPADWELLQHRGVMALVGPTGVGKTTTTAKLAANYVMQHGNDSLLLVTTDSYRIGAQQQLAIYAELLDVEMHALADGDSLDALAEKMQGKRLVLVDTVGMSQRDQRLAQKIAALGSADYSDATRIVLLLNAAAQQETLDEVARIYKRIAQESELAIHDCILTKLDETARMGGVLDTVIRHHLQVQAVSDGQRVPEDLRVPDIEQLIADTLTLELNESMLAASEWEAAGNQLEPSQVFTHGHLIQASMQKLRAQIPHFDMFIEAMQTGALPEQWQTSAFPDQLEVIRWAAPQPLQGWRHLTPHLGLNKKGLPLLPPVLQHRDMPILPDMAFAPVQLFDYLPETTLLDIFGEHQTGWLATLNVNHRMQANGRTYSVSELIKVHGIPLAKHTINYRGERRRLELTIAAAQSDQSEQVYQVIAGELHGGTGKNPIQRRYWLVDGHCTAEQVSERARMMLQTEEYARLTRLAWRALAEQLKPQSDSTAMEQYHLGLAAALAAIAMHVEYQGAANFAGLRGDLLSLSGKRGRVQGDKLVPAILHVVKAYESLVAAGRDVEAQEFNHE